MVKKIIYNPIQDCHIPGVRSFQAGHKVEILDGSRLHMLVKDNPYFTSEGYAPPHDKKPAKKSGRKRRTKKSR